MKRKVKIIALLCCLLTALSAKADGWIYSIEDAKKLAIATNKLILVDFWATWCGPCKRMDAESWNTNEIKQVMNNYVPVKIDIDSNRELAQKYGVRGIPYVFILDPNGEVVYHQMSYMKKDKLKKILLKYALNTSFLQSEFVIYHKKKNSISSFRLAQKYQDYSVYLDKGITADFLNLSKKYLKDTERMMKEEKKRDSDMKQKIKLLYIQDGVLRGSYDRCIKELNKKFTEEKVSEKNKALYYFLKYSTCKGVEDYQNSDVWLTKLKELPKSSKYLRLADKIFPQT